MANTLLLIDDYFTKKSSEKYKTIGILQKINIAKMVSKYRSKSKLKKEYSIFLIKVENGTSAPIEERRGSFLNPLLMVLHLFW